MQGKQKVIRTSIVSILAAVGFAVVAPGGAGAAEVIGQAGGPAGCAPDQIYVQDTIAGPPGYSPSSDGVITSWSSMAGASGYEMQLLVVKPDPTAANHFITTQKDTVRTLAMASALNTFTSGVRLPIGTGERLGLYVPAQAGSPPCWFVTSSATDQLKFAGPATGEPPIGTSINFAGTSPAMRRLNASAVVEPDVDKDAFGDETQDGCPQQTATQGSCATAFTVKSKTGKKSVELTANLPGAGTLSAGDANDKSLTASVAKKKKKKALFKKASVTRTETTAGDATLKVKLSSAGKKLLRQKGKLKAKLKIVYSPKSGVSGSQTIKVKLKA